MKHKIYFELDSLVAIAILEKISNQFGEITAKYIQGNLGFEIPMTRSQANGLSDLYGHYMITLCDMDQENGGSFFE